MMLGGGGGMGMGRAVGGTSGVLDDDIFGRVYDHGVVGRNEDVERLHGHARVLNLPADGGIGSLVLIGNEVDDARLGEIEPGLANDLQALQRRATSQPHVAISSVERSIRRWCVARLPRIGAWISSESHHGG